ncbi:hypothetical protein N4264_05740 [Tahibacter amnicola]|uniref:Uncharacterized protein n=1 Tax=Tahibacter amnicola TaxID=2976241 RepID=A0ABY6BHA3_9GAMM|nr:hypothetical protein [Tahibacter amnicola]UXI69152.1 hypothetical protein N4264_05740 [Tahibacter amnicola]
MTQTLQLRLGLAQQHAVTLGIEPGQDLALLHALAFFGFQPQDDAADFADDLRFVLGFQRCRTRIGRGDVALRHRGHLDRYGLDLRFRIRGGRFGLGVPPAAGQRRCR